MSEINSNFLLVFFFYLYSIFFNYFVTHATNQILKCTTVTGVIKLEY